jgi:hypothetical protein
LIQPNQNPLDTSLLMQVMLYPWVLILFLFGSLLLAVEIGRRYGWRQGDRLRIDTQGATNLSAAIFALLGLFLAFCFSGAAGRYDVRQQLILNEVTAANTVAASIDLAPAASQPQLKAAMQRYLAVRMAADRPVTSIDEAVAAQRLVIKAQDELWTLSVAANARPDASGAVSNILLPAVNALNAATTNLTLAALMHPPSVIFYILIILAWISAFLAGIGMADDKGRTWVHTLVFAAITAAVIYVTIDIEFPRVGFIRIDGFETAINALDPTS